MALNLQTFKTRALTALVFVIVMLLGLLWNVWSFMALFNIILFGCFYELAELVKKIDPTKYIRNLLVSFIYILLPILLIGNLRLTYISGPQTDSMVKVIPCAII